MSEPYTRKLRQLAVSAAHDNDVDIHRGVLAALPGPMLETKAEYRYLRLIGADAVSMSTVPEVITAVHMNMDVLGLSAITDECFPDTLEPVDIDDVIAAGNIAQPKMTDILLGVFQRL